MDKNLARKELNENLEIENMFIKDIDTK